MSSASNQEKMTTTSSTNAADLRSTERAEVLEKARRAKDIAPVFAKLTSQEKNAVLLAAAATLVEREAEIIAANEQDIAAGRERGMNDSLIDRLSLDHDRILGIAGGLEQVAALPDPVGEIVGGHVMPNGIVMRQVRVPLGVMGMVYEARPNVTVDAFGLALKSGNVALLRGSKTARHSNEALVALLQDVLAEHDLPQDGVQILPCQTHESVQDLITARGLVDVVIPRGGAGLIEAVVVGATVPTIETGTGNCHFYIDRDVLDLDQAIAMLLNGKTRRCSVCNATETALLDQELGEEAIAKVISALQEAGVTIHGDVDQFAALPGINTQAIVPANEKDWEEEYLSMDIAVKLVAGIDGALAHIRKYSTGHTEAIATGNINTAQKFADDVDSAAVMINASTAFTDGEQYGMGAEIGISTQKLHARGPMALPELTTTKWILQGNGHIRP